ncbi:MAG: DUF4145 domain-containing protein [Candidatus Bathyarchaeia archaeon]|jgi:hypothetical protein
MNPEPYSHGSTGKCPHCQFNVCFDEPALIIKTSPNGRYSLPAFMATESGGESISVYSSKCPSCQKPIAVIKVETKQGRTRRLVYPFGVVRTVPPEVPKPLQDDFLEAAAVLQISEKASAALSRRCLQLLLNDKGFNQRDLSEQIDAAIPKLPTSLGENLDAVRNIGNFAAHPLKSKDTGLIVDVEPEEAEWTLEVLEGLFDFFYVQPVRAKAKQDKLNAKLASLRKPPMKTP